jgi:glycosyltransferase involved in cell wall biosynthesis
MLSVLILLFYYQRPKLVLNALESIKDSTYTNYEVAFIDDGSQTAGEPIVREYFKDSPEILTKFKFYNTNQTKEEKEKQGGSVFGSLANQAIKDSNSDLVIMLCDDDALYPTYLEGLNSFFSEQQETKYAYSHIILFDPLAEDFQVVKKRTEASDYLRYVHTINPVCQVDSSQVAWRRSCNVEGDLWFPYPQTVNLDASFYTLLFHKYGHCNWTGLISQFKGWFAKQLSRKVDSPLMYGDTE